MSQIAASLCPNGEIESQNSQSQSNNSQIPSTSNTSGGKRNLDSVVTSQPSSTIQPNQTQSASQSAGNPPKKKSKRILRTPYEIYEGTKPLTAGEANQSRIVSSQRHSIEVFTLD